MNNTIVNLIVVVALSFSGAVLAAEEMGSKAQPPATQPVAAVSAVPPATATETTPLAPAQEPLPAVKRSTPGKHAKAKAPRSKSLDLRHCLELETNAAIARCAYE